MQTNFSLKSENSFPCIECTYNVLTSAPNICFGLEKTYPLVDIVHPGFKVRMLAPLSSVELLELGSSRHFCGIFVEFGE